jgi:hypothetical protein
MHLKQLIRAPKAIIDQGSWQDGKKMPKTAFPLSKNRGFSIRARYRWRIIKFSCLRSEFRILIFYRSDIEEYAAYLGQLTEGEMTVLCRYEYHGSHPGWHAHTTCEDVRALDSGRTSQSGLKRLKKKSDLFNMDESKALYIAYKSFGLLNTDEGLL